MLPNKKKVSKRAKDTARSALSASAVILAGALFKLGMDTGDEDLRTKYNVSLPLLSGRISQSGLISLSRDMIKYAKENMDKMKQYAITPEFISSMEDKLAAMEKTART